MNLYRSNPAPDRPERTVRYQRDDVDVADRIEPWIELVGPMRGPRVWNDDCGKWSERPATGDLRPATNDARYSRQQRASNSSRLTNNQRPTTGDQRLTQSSLAQSTGPE